MNYFNNKKQINKKEKWIFIIIIAIIIVLISTSIYRTLRIRNGLPNQSDTTENINKEGINTEKIVSISPTPSITVLTEIEDWVKEDEKEGEEFKNYNYTLTQYYGIHREMVDMILSQIREAEDKNDAEGVITLLNDFSPEFENAIRAVEENESNGVIPPKFIITQVEKQITEFKVKDVKNNIIFLAFNQRLEILNINRKDKEELLKKMEKTLKGKIYPNYSELEECFKNLESKANMEAGVWKLENGERYYAYMLKHNTSLDITPEEVYELGLKETNKIQAEIGKEFKKLGYKGTLKENMHSLNNDTNFLYPQDKLGREEILRDYEKIIEDMNAHIGEMFDIVPASKLKVLPVPEFTEGSTAQAYYYPASADDSPGIFYVNTSKPTYKYDMQSIAYHEGMPGHHLQMALQMELLSEKYPEKSSFYIPAYVEGWGLYAEKLADEYGMYKDPYSRLGYLRGELLRSVRLMVDTGIHFKKWTREYAIEYMKGFGCIPDEYVPTEVDRYIVSPGQASSYKIGEIKIIELREKARAELGEKFNIKDFHNVILRNGPMPFEIMEREVQRYIGMIK